jgi:hypothetical protein
MGNPAGVRRWGVSIQRGNRKTQAGIILFNRGEMGSEARKAAIAFGNRKNMQSQIVICHSETVEKPYFQTGLLSQIILIGFFVK